MGYVGRTLGILWELALGRRKQSVDEKLPIPVPPYRITKGLTCH